MHTLFFFVGRDVGHHVGHQVHRHVGHLVSHHVGLWATVSTLCEVSMTLTEWKSKTITDGLIRVGARDTCVSKNC
mgnify:CR=1 FL=1